MTEFPLNVTSATDVRFDGLEDYREITRPFELAYDLIVLGEGSDFLRQPVEHSLRTGHFVPVQRFLALQVVTQSVLVNAQLFEAIREAV